MKGKGDNPIVGSETTDIYDVENHGYKKYNSLEMDDLRAFATRWTAVLKKSLCRRYQGRRGERGDCQSSWSND